MKQITRTINITTLNVKVYDPSTKAIKDDTITFNESSRQNAVIAAYEDMNGVKIVEIVSSENESKKFSMPVNDFIKACEYYVNGEEAFED